MFDPARAIGGFKQCALGKADIRGARRRSEIVDENIRTVRRTLDREPVDVGAEILTQTDACRCARETVICNGWIIQRVVVEYGLYEFIVCRVIDNDIIATVIDQCRATPGIKKQIIRSTGWQAAASLNTDNHHRVGAGLQNGACRERKPVPCTLIPQLQPRNINRDIRGIYKFDKLVI